MYSYLEYSNYWLKFFVVLNMLICNLNEEHTCPLSEKKVGIVQFPVQFDESHFSLTFQAIINGQNFDKPVLQVIVSYIVLIIFVFIHLNNMQCFFFKETLDFILLMLIISNTLFKNILSVNIFEYLFMFIIDFINNK